MLKDAALLQLELSRARACARTSRSRTRRPTTSSGAAAEPVFIDVGSFERLRPGEPWAGYRQFCMLFLYPLMLQAYKDLPYHALRCAARSTGSRRADARGLLAGERFRKRRALQRASCTRGSRRATRDAGGREVKREMRRAGFSKELLDANLRQAREARAPARVDRPARRRGPATASTTPTTTRRPRRKAEFVRAAAARRPGGLTWDLGCNDGRTRASRPSRRPRGGVRRRPRHRRRALPALRDEGRRTSCRS